MKKFFSTSLWLISIALSISACSTEENDNIVSPIITNQAITQSSTTIDFPQDDGSKRPNKIAALALEQLLRNFDNSRAISLGETTITDEQFSEIKVFVDENLQDETDYKTYRKIFEWITNNLTYANSGDAWVDAYDVYKNKRCVCQGYANLLKVMCLTQNIPVFIVNGMYSTIGAHAWNYVYVSNRWYVSDPTNGKEFKVSDTSKYKDIYIPYRTDLYLYEDDKFAYDMQEGQFNIAKIKNQRDDYVVIPYSKEGWRITSFYPQSQVDENITKLYIGANIETFGSYPEMLRTSFPSLEQIEIDPANTTLNTFHSVVYQGESETPYVIPPSIRSLQLKTMKTVEKNTLLSLPVLEEITFSEGTERIEAYAIEDCPNLRTVYIPTTVTYIDVEAFYRCSDNIQIVTMPTGITEVKISK